MLVPAAPGLLCAEGLLRSDLKAEFHRTLPRAGRPGEAATNALADALRAEAEAWLAGEQVAVEDRAYGTAALMRYEGQGGELAVPWTGTEAAALAAFDAAHQALYGFTIEAPVEFVTVRVEATGRMPSCAAQPLVPAPMPQPDGTQRVHFAAGSRDVPVLDRAKLGAGAAFAGPAIVVQLDATTLVPPDWHAETHPSGALLLRRH